MEYQEIVTAYNNDSLEISSLKEKLEIAKPLKGRSKYRALSRIEGSIDLIFTISNTLVMPETPEKCEQFEKNCNRILDEYYTILSNSMEETDSWEFLKLKSSDYSREKFDELNSEEKFKMLLELNEKYTSFLEYQKVADIRDCLDKGVELDDKTIKRLIFLNKMLEASENPRTKTEFYMFNEEFLVALTNYRKSKNTKLDKYMKARGKGINEEYTKISKFFSDEELKDIADNLILSSKTLKISIPNVIQAFSEISETEMEIEYFLSEHDEINQLEAKSKKMQSIKEKIQKSQKEANIKLEQLKKQLENEETVEHFEDEEHIGIENEEDTQREENSEKENQDDTELGEQKNNSLEGEQADDKYIKISQEEYKSELKEEIKEIQEIPIAKEAVNFIKLFWFQREEKQSASTMTAKQLSDFLDKVKQMEIETGIRSSLFLITNSDEEITRKRFQILQNEATNRGMPRLLEGALGGYSSFKIDLDGSVKNISQMSEVNREKIIALMNSYGIEDSYINHDEKEYIRYEFSNENDKSITLLSLSRLKEVLENRIRRAKQPIEILTFVEGNYSGLDVVLNSQIVGIAQISTYYDSKYNVLNKKGFTVYSNNIDNFDFHKNKPKDSIFPEREE